MSAMVTTAYSGLSSAQSAVKSAQAEVAAGENTLRADVAVLKQVETNETQLRLVESVVAADQQLCWRRKTPCAGGKSFKRRTDGSATGVSCKGAGGGSRLSGFAEQGAIALLLRESLAKDALKLDRT